MIIKTTLKKSDPFYIQSQDMIKCISWLMSEKSDLLKYFKLPKRNLRWVIRKILGKTLGQCQMYKYEHTKSKKLEYDYIIEVDVRQPPEMFFVTVLHELVHIEQYFTKKLRCDKNRTATWKKRIYTLGELTKLYFELPWEIEAVEKSERLAPIIFKDAYKHSKRNKRALH